MPGGGAPKKTCSQCKTRTRNMVDHYKSSSDHGPISSDNSRAQKDFPGLFDLSSRLGSLFFGSGEGRRF